MTNFKNNIIQKIINLGYKLDNMRGKLSTYDYETAPYCGHHHNGTKGSLYNAGYYEGEGSERVKFLGFTFKSSTYEDNNSWSWKFPYDLELNFRLLCNFSKDKKNPKWVNLLKRPIKTFSITDVKEDKGIATIWFATLKNKNSSKLTLSINLKKV